MFMMILAVLASSIFFSFFILVACIRSSQISQLEERGTLQYAQIPATESTQSANQAEQSSLVLS